MLRLMTSCILGLTFAATTSAADLHENIEFLTRQSGRAAAKKNYAAAYPLFVQHKTSNKVVALKQGFVEVKFALNNALNAEFEGSGPYVDAIRSSRWAAKQGYGSGFLNWELAQDGKGIVVIKREAVEAVIAVQRKQLDAIRDEFLPGANAEDFQDRFAIVDKWLQKNRDGRTGFPNFEQSTDGSGEVVYGIVVLKPDAAVREEWSNTELKIPNSALGALSDQLFPLTASETSKIGEGQRMETKVVLYKNGKIDISSRLVADTPFGFTGAVVVSFVDAEGNLGQQVRTDRRGVNGKSATDLEWSGHIAPEYMAKAVGIYIRNIHDPNPDRVEVTIGKIMQAAERVAEGVDKVHRIYGK